MAPSAKWNAATRKTDTRNSDDKRRFLKQEKFQEGELVLLDATESL